MELLGRSLRMSHAKLTAASGWRPRLASAREGFREVTRVSIGLFATLLIAIVTTGIATAMALDQSMSSSMDNMLAAFATGKSTQSTIHVIPHTTAPAHDRQAAVFDAQPAERHE